MNEGHAGFLALERIRELVTASSLSFDEALEVVRASTLFTTHTPVPAGIDRFPRDLVEHHFGPPDNALGLPIDRVLRLGSESFPGGDPSVFNMALMGLRVAQRANGVSLLHGAGQPGDVRWAVAEVRLGRCPDHLGDQRRARADVGFA